MNCLYIDASRDRLSIGLECGSKWRANESIEGRHDQVLLEAIRGLCNDAMICTNEISHCVVVNGPGSFTGLRIAVSCVHALDLVQPLRVLPVDQLSLLAASCDAPHAGSILDARMGEVYVGSNRDDNGLYSQLELKSINALGQDTWICHAEEADRFSVSLVPVVPTLHVLKQLAQGCDFSQWIEGSQLTPRYVRQTVSWKPLSEQPSKLYDH